MTDVREAHKLIQRWYAEGEAAAIASLPPSACPYGHGTIPQFWWCQGYLFQILSMQNAALRARVNLFQAGLAGGKAGSDRN